MENVENEYRRYAPIGLIVALIALLAMAGFWVFQETFGLYAQISLAVAVAGVVAYLLLNPEGVRSLLLSRQGRYGSNALIMSLAVLAILVVINYIVYQNPQRWDLTEDSRFTLSQEARQTLAALPEPVEALAFYPSSVSPDRAEDWLRQFKLASNGMFDYRFIDPVKDPLAAREVDAVISSQGTIVLRMGDRRETVAYLDEREITTAMVRLMGDEAVVYFLTGHGELDPNGSGEMSLARLKRTLESKSYTVNTLNLGVDRAVPEDAAAIVIAGPQTSLLENEITLIDAYLDRGGSLVVLAEPAFLTSLGDQPDLLADYLMANWNIVYGADIVIDRGTQAETPFEILVGRDIDYSQSHIVTQKLIDARLGSYFPTARSVRTAANSLEAVAVELIYSTEASWGETDIDLLTTTGNAQYDESADLVGPVSIAVAAENMTTEGRVIAFGDSEFAADIFIQFLGNLDLAVNAIDWAAEQEAIINLTPREQTQRILLQPKLLTKISIWLGALILPAVLVIGLGVYTAVRRKSSL